VDFDDRAGSGRIRGQELRKGNVTPEKQTEDGISKVHFAQYGGFSFSKLEKAGVRGHSV